MKKVVNWIKNDAQRSLKIAIDTGLISNVFAFVEFCPDNAQGLSFLFPLKLLKTIN